MGISLGGLLGPLLLGVIGAAPQPVGTPGSAAAVELPNPSLEDNGRGWTLWNPQNGLGQWSSEGAHRGKTCALIRGDAQHPRSLLVSPPLAQLEPGARVAVSFFVRWLEGDDQVFVGFQEDQEGAEWDAWRNRWRGGVPRDGQWHRLRAEMQVPLFLQGESRLQLRIGLPYQKPSLWGGGAGPFPGASYLIDDLALEILGQPQTPKPRPPVVHSFDPCDPRDDASPYGVYWTPWEVACMPAIRAPGDHDKTPEKIDLELDAMQRIGVKWIRSVWRWDKIEWQAGQFDDGLLDRVVAAAGKRGIRFVPCLASSPPWASTAPPGTADARRYPPRLPAWEAFVVHVVDHFKPLVKYWEIWNEPNIHPYWDGSSKDLYELQKTAYAAAKRADPTCRILMGAFSETGRESLEDLLKLGAKDYFDILSCHPYAGKQGPERIDFMLRSLALVLTDYGCGERPIWLTEIGWSAQHVPSPARRAELLTELYTRRFDPAVEKIFWYRFADWSAAESKNFGLAGAYDGQLELRPTYHAYGQVTERISP